MIRRSADRPRRVVIRPATISRSLAIRAFSASTPANFRCSRTQSSRSTLSTRPYRSPLKSSRYASTCRRFSPNVGIVPMLDLAAAITALAGVLGLLLLPRRARSGTPAPDRDEPRVPGALSPQD